MSADLITQDALREALSIAKELKQPIGKVLTSTQQVSEQSLQSALLAQSMINQELVEVDVAVETLKLAVAENVTFGEALATVNKASTQTGVATELEELLLKSGMVSPQVMTEAKKISLETNTPLGSSLVARRAIVFAHLNYAFECITLIEKGRLSKEAAIAAMSDIKKENTRLSVALSKQKVSIKKTQWKLNLGDLLTAGSIISEKDNLSAVEQALSEKRMIGEILVKSNLVSSDLLKNALELQSLVTKGVMSKDQAAVALRQVASQNKPVDQVLREGNFLKDDPETAKEALELLFNAKIVEPHMVPSAVAAQERYQMDPLKALVASDAITADVCHAATECTRRVAANAMTPQNAILIVDQCDRMRIDFDQSLSELSLGPQQTIEKQSSKWSGKYVAHSQTNVHQVPSWSRSIEFKMAVIAVIIGIAGAVLVVLDAKHLNTYGLCAVVLVVGISFFALGRIWETRIRQKKNILKKQEDEARQQVTRLAKKKTMDDL